MNTQPDIFDYGDLRSGLEHFIEKPVGVHNHEGLQPLIDAAKHVNFDFNVVDFITWRGVITRLASSLISKDQWKLEIEVLDGRIYVQEVRNEMHFSKSHRMAMFGGHKFERLCMISAKSQDITNMKSRQDEIVNTNCEFVSVFKTRLGKFNLLMGAEIDGIDENQRYVELKTSTEIKNENARSNFIRHKLAKWWLQSFLAGIEDIVVGYRNSGGWLTDLSVLKVSSIPGIARPLGFWEAQSLLSFADLALDFIKKYTLEAHRDFGLSRFTLIPECPGTPDFFLTMESCTGAL